MSECESLKFRTSKSLSPLSMSVPVLRGGDICCRIHYLREIFSDKWILNPCYLCKATDEVHNSFDLVSYTTPSRPHPPLLNRSPAVLFTMLNLRIYYRAKSNCAYNVKDCCQCPYIMPTHGIHGYVKYTCPHEIYMTMVCIQSPWL